MRLTYRDSTVPHINAKGELWEAYSDRNYNEIINKLSFYEDAEEQGRLVPVVRGKWHDWYHMLMPDCYVATCSNCGKAHRYLGMGLLNYCPNCGADMRGDISSFTPEERKTYWEAIEQKSIDTGVNIHDLI